MAYTEKDFTLSWGDITIGQPNTLVVTRPSALYSFSFRYDFQGVSAAVTDAELTVVSQDDTREFPKLKDTTTKPTLTIFPNNILWDVHHTARNGVIAFGASITPTKFIVKRNDSNPNFLHL